MEKEQRDFLTACRNRYRGDLTGNILPFWLRHGWDRVNGGVYTCVDRDGTLMDSTKSVWFQGRFGYVCALAYNTIEKNENWLAASRSAVDFLLAHCVDVDGHFFFTVTATGEPVQKRRYVFSECFAIMALAEYAKASGELSYARKAREIYLHTLEMLSTPGFLPPKTYEAARGHSVTMMFINVAGVLRNALPDPMLDTKIEESVAQLKQYFYKPEYHAILETVGMNGEFIDTLAGRTINPGHGIETSWFIMDEGLKQHNKAYIDFGLQILEGCWQWGWDEPWGGIINFKDCKGFPPQDYSQDMKFWWPQCEAIIATLYAYRATGDAKYLEWHRMAHEWAFSHFADSEQGEWYGYLHRDGTVAQPAKGNLFKGPFHVPRMMIKSSLLIDEILKA